MSNVVVNQVETEIDCIPTELPPLYKTIDPETLEFACRLLLQDVSDSDVLVSRSHRNCHCESRYFTNF
ncbi:hypothetical protein [Natronomonas salsuginis]|uniref:hypothetical protein n=1 Tax=Natronomonas salsuginis TaxID=2217661 RepID=UPI003742164F